MPTKFSQFTPAATVTLQATQLPQIVQLPAFDAANQAVMLQNQGPGEAAILAGTISWSPFESLTAVRVKPGQSVLANSPSLSGSAEATIQAHGGAVLTFVRGSLADVWLFPTAQ